MDKKFAIFDMDGTLVDSMPYWDGIFREYLESVGIREDLREAMDAIRPKMLQESTAYMIDRFHLDITVEEMIAKMNGLMEQHYLQHIGLKKGVKEYLEELRCRGVKMCVASATKPELMRLCLEKLGVLDYFEFVLSCEDVGEGKNKPTVYYVASEKLGAEKAEDVAVYEDSYFAALTAYKAGFYVVGIYDNCAKDHWEEIKKLAGECRDWRG